MVGSGMNGATYCPTCGGENPARARFCNNCGGAVRPAVPAPPLPEPVRPPDLLPRLPAVAPPARDEAVTEQISWSERPPSFGVDAADAFSEREPAFSEQSFEVGPKLLWWTIPAESLLHGHSFRALMAMRLATETAINALTYGMLVEVVRRTESGFQASLVTVSTVAPAALFGILGGAVVDRANKRWMLVLTNLLRALLCFGFLMTGRHTSDIFLLLVIITIATQFATPAESSIVPRVVPPARLAGANSFSHLAESAGQLLGMAILAPLFVKFIHNASALILSCGVIFLYASARAVAIRTHDPPAPAAVPEQVTLADRRPWLAGTRESLVESWRYLSSNRPAFITMMLLVLASTANLVMVTLAPRFTQQVLELGPESAIFVFGPAVVGMLGGLALVPRLVNRVRPRVLALAGFLMMVLSLLLIGALGPVTDILRSLNPFWLYDPGPFGSGPLAHAEGRVGTVMLLAVPLGFSFAVVQISANTFLHSQVPMAMHGRVFALQGAIKNATAIAPLLLLGGLASVVGVQPVLVIAPLLILFLALYGASQSARWAAQPPAAAATAGG